MLSIRTFESLSAAATTQQTNQAPVAHQQAATQQAGGRTVGTQQAAPQESVRLSKKSSVPMLVVTNWQGVQLRYLCRWSSMSMILTGVKLAI